MHNQSSFPTFYLKKEADPGRDLVTTMMYFFCQVKYIQCEAFDHHKDMAVRNWYSTPIKGRLEVYYMEFIF
jgi:hypothetical protein